jgi:ribosomal protein L39E
MKEKKKTPIKKRHVHKKQKALEEKKAKLAVKARQTKWAPVWVVLKKYGMGKRIHPSATTKYRRSWRRTKLHIKPRRIRKWHMG